MAKRSRNIVIKSQFNIGGSRGKSVKPFITNYVSRESATKPVFGYRPLKPTYEIGDGSCFTFSKTAISRNDVLRIADDVEYLFQTKMRAIQQLVVSFDQEYLRKMNIIDNNVDILKKGDYEDNYDEVRLRHVIRRGIREIADRDGYNEPKMIATIQHDTHHIHAHVVLYENSKDIARKRGNEEKGVIKNKSFLFGTMEMDRVLDRTKSINVTRKKMTLMKDQSEVNSQTQTDDKTQTLDRSFELMQNYMNLIYLKQKLEQEEKEKRLQEELKEKMNTNR